MSNSMVSPTTASMFSQSLPPLRIGAAALIAAAILTGGCGGKQTADLSTAGGGEKLDAASFGIARTEESPSQAAALAVAARDAAIAAEDPAPKPRLDAEVIGPMGASEGVSDAVARTTTPDVVPGVKAGPVSGAVLVDAKVGDINGRPIFADSFLAPLSARLTQRAKELPRQQWRTFARTEISREVIGQVRDELLRAETLSQLKPEQKQGLFSYLDKVQKDLESENRGSREAASRRLFSEEGKTIDEFREKSEEAILIQEQIKKIDSRVQVSWRDIQRGYDNLKDELSNSTEMRFRVLQVPASKPELIAQVIEDLKTKSFEEVARSPANIFKADVGGLEERVRAKGNEKPDYFRNPLLNDAASKIRGGQVAGPLKLATTAAWVYLEPKTENVPSLYESQLQVEDTLRTVRRQREQDRYFRRLIERASLTNPDEMVEALALIAEDRYYPN